MTEIESFLHDLGQPWRRAGEGAWGVTLPDVGGWPLDVGLRLRGTAPRLLQLQAPVCEPGLLDPADLLRRGRRRPLVRFTATQAGEVWVQADVPWPASGRAVLDVTLALLVEAAEDARHAASAARTERSR